MNKICCIIIISLFIGFGLNLSSQPRKAPGIALYDLNDNLVTLSSLTQKSNVVIAFWASYCAPCQKEIPQLVALENKYAEEKKARLLLVNIDKEGREKALPFMESMGITSTCLVDSYQVNARKYIPKLKIPAIFLVNTKGYIVFEASGESPENIANLEEAILKL